MRGFEVVEPGVWRDPRSGKIYTSVSYRTKQFRKDHPEWGVNFIEVPYGTKEEYNEDPRGRFIKMRCEIRNENERLISVGHAEEDRKFGPVNKTSAIENVETSAFGRALAALGYVTDEYASAEEVDKAISTERNMDKYERGDHPAAVREEVRAKYQAKKQSQNQQSTPAKAEYSQRFSELLVMVQTAEDGAMLREAQSHIKQSQPDLAQAELDELRTQFLAARARLS